MDQHVAKSGEAAPWNLLMDLPILLRHALGRFTYNFEVAYDSILNEGVSEKGLEPARCVSADTPNGFENLSQINAGIFHKGRASFKIRLRKSQ